MGLFSEENQAHPSATRLINILGHLQALGNVLYIAGLLRHNLAESHLPFEQRI
jgi:hypothetical protein